MSELYDNLLKATNNVDDITTEKYATITKLNGNYCDAKEEDTGLEHTNIPIINGANLSVGDKVIIGFISNSIYDVVCYGALDKTIHDDSKQDLLISGQNIKTINHTSLLGSGNIDIQGGGSDVDIVTSWEPTPSDTKVPSEKLTKNTLDNKVDKSSTTGLLKNDGSVDTNSYLTSSSLSNYVQKSSTTGLLKNDGTVDTTQYLSSLPTHNHDDRYYTESEVDTALNGKQDTLVSGTSIKTINNTSLLGSGNITVGGGGNVPTKTSDLTNDGEDGVNPFVSDDDSRLSDARTPTSHTHTSNQVTDLIDIIYPVGSIYMSVNSTSPQTLFGGTWEQIKDTFLLSSGDTYSNGATGGSATVSLSASQMPRHNHSTNAHSHSTSDSGEYFVTSTQSTANNTRVTYSSSGNRMVDGFNTTSSIFHHRANTNSQSPSTKYTGGTGSTESASDGSAHENMPPYIVVNVWKRTA